MILLSAILLAGCLAVKPAADHITAGDLVPLFPGLETVPADTPLGWAPAPGVSRVFRVPELAAFAANFHLDAPHSEICVQRTVTPPDPARMLTAMQKVLPTARIEILDFSRRAIPDGEMEFARSGLREEPSGAFWGGNIRYAGTRLFPIWAKVAVWVKVQRVVALSDLERGAVVNDSMVRVETRDEFPTAGDFPESADQVLGQAVRLPIRAGTAIRKAQLEAPKEVLNGETVIVDVWSGGAHLKLEARAQSSGTIGEMIPVRNLSSQKSFLARVDGKGRVSVKDPFESDRNQKNENDLDNHHLVSATGPAVGVKEKD
jgi:flagellar basal body P-ring formation protein FlgA